jgi:mRNA-degrading endonuclease toxin of MazEF toxin-antitoxin module
MAHYRAAIEAEKAAREKGLLPQGLVKDLVPGSVWLADDKAIGFPEGRLSSAGSRSLHDYRRVIVVQATKFARNKVPLTLLVVPCSASQDPASLLDCDFALPQGSSGFDHPYVVAHVRLVQPILKSELHQCKGHLEAPTFLALRRKLAEVLGLIDLPMMELAPR